MQFVGFVTLIPLALLATPLILLLPIPVVTKPTQTSNRDAPSHQISNQDSQDDVTTIPGDVKPQTSVKEEGTEEATGTSCPLKLSMQEDPPDCDNVGILREGSYQQMQYMVCRCSVKIRLISESEGTKGQVVATGESHIEISPQEQSVKDKLVITYTNFMKGRSDKDAEAIRNFLRSMKGGKVIDNGTTGLTIEVTHNK